MSSGIYKITNLITQDSYIGSSVNLNSRKRTHFATDEIRTLFGKMKMKEIASKYGVSVSTIELIKMNKLWVA